ncbi:MAG: Signal peptide peptidase SppA (protease 4) [Cytophagales bacterium]|jgi:protease-4|nr:MAG: Signal peptide peptidase SppA (protease 4) [Cytophagales bacterium]
MNFFKTFLASCLGSLVALVLLFFLMVSFFSVLVAGFSDSDKTTTVSENSVLQLKLNGPITESETENPLEGLPFPGADEMGVGLLPLKQSIAHAKTGPAIKGIYLDVSSFQGGFAVAKEIRESLIDFRLSGKWVMAYSESYSESSYYLVSAADKVYLNPEGDLEFNGLAVEVSFFKRMFDKLEIKPEIFRVGDFKSAVEPFFLDKMSDANRLQLKQLMEDLNGTLIKEVAESRKISEVELKNISAKMLITSPAEAIKYKLIDTVKYFDQVQTELRSMLGIGKKEKISFVKYNKYKRSFTSPATSKNEIAVIVADGDIMPGKAQEGTIGSDTFAEELRKARTNDKVKAIVLRINSPGGSALASDVMWREVTLASKEKPIIASMSNYAASGGYYLAMGCDSIVAEPNTITGSIGVFSVLFDLSSFLDKKIGITFDETKTGEVGNMTTFTRPLTEIEKIIWQKKTNKIYEGFTTKAAKGRKMSVENILKIASGRVWSGMQAKQNGLVDVLGGFNDAVTIAAKKAGIDKDYKLRFYPKQKSFFAQWLQDMEGSARTKILEHELGENYQVIQQIKQVKNFAGVQARLPFEMQWK